jgi:hypothetical protein
MRRYLSIPVARRAWKRMRRGVRTHTTRKRVPNGRWEGDTCVAPICHWLPGLTDTSCPFLLTVSCTLTGDDGRGGRRRRTSGCATTQG